MMVKERVILNGRDPISVISFPSSALAKTMVLGPASAPVHPIWALPALVLAMALRNVQPPEPSSLSLVTVTVPACAKPVVNRAIASAAKPANGR
ncbi:hypothetical protein [Acidovorax sp. ST3]|uniref:hypothetical protein n=1 Tax=Acidovorax sp. ST3 TaxID=2219062 RepID=UPI00193E6670|nr:hypothetical protein [Acidovorax sp. ST3]